jgi:ribosomal protein S19
MIKVPKRLEKDINMILTQKGVKFLQEFIDTAVICAKQEIYKEHIKEYINDKMTGKEFYALTNFLPTREMNYHRLTNIKKKEEKFIEAFYLKILAENGDYFGYTDEYFSEIILKIEGKI